MVRREKDGNWVESREPVVDSFEWTTSWGGKLGKDGNRGKSHEPVVHFVEWTTSSLEKVGNQVKSD